MPKYEQTNTIEGLDKESILSVCYSSFIELSWNIQFAGEDTMLAATPKSWNSNSQRIIATAADNKLTISSEMTRGELFDLAKRNKKNVTAFFNAFNTARNSIQHTENENNLKAIAELRNETARIAAKEQVEAAEVDKAMNLSGGNLYATYTIIALNVIVFILMVLDGAGIMGESGLVYVKWGSNFGPLTLSGDWWRLITNVFIHFGIVHLLLNMYCLYIIGSYLERMLGKARYIAAYLCTGILASITSLWWHNVPVNSAGASGAIFGMYGLFLAFLLTKLIPQKVRRALLQSIGIFIVYNLLYGMKGSVDNSAHVGGLISGFIIGCLYVTGVKKEKQDQPVAAQWMISVILLITACIGFFYLQQHKSTSEERKEVLSEIKNGDYKDNKKFDASFGKILELQDSAMVALTDTTITDETRDTLLKEKALPLWNEAVVLASEMQSFDVSENAHRKADNLAQYIQLREQEIAVIDSIVGGKADISRLNEVRHNINLVLEALK